MLAPRPPLLLPREGDNHFPFFLETLEIEMSPSPHSVSRLPQAKTLISSFPFFSRPSATFLFSPFFPLSGPQPPDGYQDEVVLVVIVCETFSVGFFSYSSSGFPLGRFAEVSFSLFGFRPPFPLSWGFEGEIAHSPLDHFYLCVVVCFGGAAVWF